MKIIERNWKHVYLQNEQLVQVKPHIGPALCTDVSRTHRADSFHVAVNLFPNDAW